MAHSGFAVRLDPALVGPVLTRLALALLALALPVVAGVLAGLFVIAGPPAAGVGLALGAMDGPLLAGVGPAWLFHVSTLTLLGGCWLLGAGLLLSGLYG